MAVFTSSIDITNNGTYDLRLKNGTPYKKMSSDLNGKMENIHNYLQSNLPETCSSLPTSLPHGKLIIYDNKVYFGNSDGIPTKAGSDVELSDLDLKADKHNTVLTGSISMGRVGSIGKNSIAIGDLAEASGSNSQAEGYMVTASGAESHAEGFNSCALASVSHAEGHVTKASGRYSHSEGSLSIASGYCSHAEGGGTVRENDTDIWVEASGGYSHAEGYGTTASGQCAHSEGRYTIASGECAHGEGNGTEEYKVTASGNYSHAEGYMTVASGIGSHAEGGTNSPTTYRTIASGDYSHAEGIDTNAKGEGSHSEGGYTRAHGIYSHAEGCSCDADSDYSHAGGLRSDAMCTCSFSMGNWATAENYASFAIGKANRYYDRIKKQDGDFDNTVGDVFVIGNGIPAIGDHSSSSSHVSNCFRVTYAGATYGLSNFNSSGADYAEYFEWKDGNFNNEDRVGHFVTLEGNKIKIANAGDYILGIVSGQPCIIGNADEDWLGRWEHDEYGRFVKEYLEKTDEVDDNGNHVSKVVDYETSSWRYKANPDYDSTQQYIERKDRKEWSAVGMVGVLSVRDDGTCKVNEYCKVSDGGIATSTVNELSIDNVKIVKGYRVSERVSDNIIKVILK